MHSLLPALISVAINYHPFPLAIDNLPLECMFTKEMKEGVFPSPF